MAGVTPKRVTARIDGDFVVFLSDHHGRFRLAGFAIRGRELVVYLVPEGEQQSALLSRPGRHRMGKSGLYLKRLSDLDMSILEQLVAGSVRAVKRGDGWPGGPE